MNRPSKPQSALFGMVAVVIAAAGTYAADSLALTELYEWPIIFLVLLTGAIGGLAVVYYAFQLDAAAAG